MGLNSLHQLLVRNVIGLAWCCQALNDAVCGCTVAAEEDRALFPALLHIVGHEVALQPFHVRGPILSVLVELADPCIVIGADWASPSSPDVWFWYACEVSVRLQGG